MEENQQTSKRGKSFTLKQDIAICEAYLCVTQDRRIGNSQSLTNFWNRIFQNYIQSISDDARSQVSIQSLWGMIMKCCNKFFGFLTQIENTHNSGMTETDKVTQAKFLYLEIEKKHFNFDHCWTILEKSIKWQQLPNTSTRPKNSTTMGDSVSYTPTQELNTLASLESEHEKTEESVGKSGNTRGSAESSRGKRPMGRKLVKVSRRKSKLEDPVVLVFPI